MITKQSVAAAAHAVLGLALLGFVFFAQPPSAASAQKVKLVVGSQDAAVPAIVEASGVLDGAPYEIQWAVLPGPAAQLSGLYSKALDVGLMGDTSLIIEQGKAKETWTEGAVPLQIVAGWRKKESDIPPIVTTVRKSANINKLEDLRGKKWAFNFGGFNYLQYVLTRLKAGLTEKDFEPIQLGDGNASAAAFNSGRADVYSGSIIAVKETLDKGEAQILISSDELDIPALTVFTARGDVIRNAEKGAALADFLARLRKHWDWYKANVPAVEKLYVEKIKQSPARAKFSADFGAASFQPLDATLVAREQRIADALFSSGVIPKKIDVTIEYAAAFNSSTTQ
jgi:sulfonate transport system substrate-binding protein